MAGLIPFEGTIDVNGVDLRRQRRAYTKMVSFAEAEPVYPSFLTGNELLNFYLQTKGANKSETKRIAEALGLAPFLNNKTATYSSGMMKKLSLLLCFVGNPVLLLLDEPFVTLDVAAVHALQQLICACGRDFLFSFLRTRSYVLAKRTRPCAFTGKPSKAKRVKRVLLNVFVRSFYKANAGFFLFFFFVFFGAVEGNSLLSYHLSLMKSILSSGLTLLLAFLFWRLTTSNARPCS